MKISHVWYKSPKRGRSFSNGRSEAPALIRLEGEKITRRVYKDWTRLNKNGSGNPKKWSPVPLVILIKGVVTTIPEDLVEAHSLREPRR